MIKPKRLRAGDQAAVVSLSWGGLGDAPFLHRYRLAKECLERDFGLRVRPMPHALKGSAFLAAHPELRARDLMDAFLDPEISAIFCAIGGDDTIRLLPYIDFDIIRAHPKIFMGYSDTTINHFMMQKAGLISFYGPSVMGEFGEYGGIFDYTADAVRALLFQGWDTLPILSSPVWSSDFIPWEASNLSAVHTLRPELHGYEVISGGGVARGRLLGGCVDVFMMASGTAIWPSPGQWESAILFLETSEEKPSPTFLTWALRNLAAQGILARLSGILVGKPQGEQYYEAYKEVYIQVVAVEERLTQLPIFYNVNFGHAKPIGVLPCGTLAELNCEERSITLLECPTVP